MAGRKRDNLLIIVLRKNDFVLRSINFPVIEQTAGMQRFHGASCVASDLPGN